jgi:hypothetical protein
MNSILRNLSICSKYLKDTGKVHTDTNKYIRQYEKYIAVKELKGVKMILESQLNVQDLSNKIDAIKSYCVGDGCGLKTGTYVDDLVTAYFKKYLMSFDEHHVGEADMKICNIPLSLKTCTNKHGTTFALNWSKNGENSVVKPNFDTHIMIIVSHGGHWWKRKEGYNEYVHAGIYLIDRYYCQDNITLESNNKTDKLISKRNVYKMIMNSTFYVKLPTPQTSRPSFNILNAFDTDSTVQ